MERKIRVGAVSYLNTKPLVYGFEHGMMEDQVELLFDYPARVANMLLSDEIDIGLIPVTELGKLSGYQIISDYCIGASEAVASVCLFSEVPIDEVEEILLDYQSRTSVARNRKAKTSKSGI
ncbi:MAG: MqnA/MqnD/SBP family protein [Ferruginibacter sp.]